MSDCMYVCGGIKVKGESKLQEWIALTPASYRTNRYIGIHTPPLHPSTFRILLCAVYMAFPLKSQIRPHEELRPFQQVGCGLCAAMLHIAVSRPRVEGKARNQTPHPKQASRLDETNTLGFLPQYQGPKSLMPQRHPASLC